MHEALELRVPSHVPRELVVEDFDIYNLPLPDGMDPQASYAMFRDRGDIFWSPNHGGHWVLTRGDDIKQVQNDWQNFIRSPQVSIPPVEGVGIAYPIQLDPPQHADFRRPLTKALLPKVVDTMANKVADVCAELIDAFKDKGECDFVAQFSQIFPIIIFLDLVNLPRSDREYLLPFAETSCRGATIEDRYAAFVGISQYLTPIIVERQANPGDDLFSAMVNVEIDGAKIPFEAALQFCSTVIVAGLDTVAAMLGFVTRHFALHPDQRREMAERYQDDAFIDRVVEELLRRYAIANSSRVSAHDQEYRGVKFAKGDMILTANVYVALDDRQIDRPMEVDFNRSQKMQHASFDVGPHTCPGATLARRELRVFLQEWFRRIPDFGIKPGTTPRMATGMVSSVLELELVFPAQD
ncbi:MULTISPECIES: cytochrome P450 [unclassified Sphingobium]|uniref:cytochrome P450 n=1 Tax=unclassified Sphingobium TaxID=2611147 RepID=UPI00119BBDD5|nr:MULTISPECIES: cytochrome P450 [unclassified Sphingobium]MBG6120108.1 cytochrome P450 [Sphingobium sp. JAI105]TWD05691.1 cytochrome P450 [Sphingobium sp. AEW010]TWD23244.1 cytochrome P450 [Sphingobium sp. AEW013]TWD25104.1 cytochrome P450 [Sphingobium sp. AEW001]